MKNMFIHIAVFVALFLPVAQFVLLVSIVIKRKQKETKPLCRYCGKEMKMDGVHGSFWYACPKCNSYAPMGHNPEEAYIAAMRKPIFFNVERVMKEAENIG